MALHASMRPRVASIADHIVQRPPRGPLAQKGPSACHDVSARESRAEHAGPGACRRTCRDRADRPFFPICNAFVTGRNVIRLCEFVHRRCSRSRLAAQEPTGAICESTLLGTGMLHMWLSKDCSLWSSRAQQTHSTRSAPTLSGHGGHGSWTDL